MVASDIVNNKYKQEEGITKMAQVWLDGKYPKKGVCKGGIDENNKGKSRGEIEELKIGKGSLEGQLDLRDFKNLKKLVCNGNKITSLNLKGLIKLENLNCSDNQIIEIELSDNTELRELFCHKNPLKKITGLEKLRKLTSINSDPFNFITSELGENIDNAKKLLSEYSSLMEEEIIAYQKTINSEVFSQVEKNESRLEIEKYQAQIEQVGNLINKWK